MSRSINSPVTIYLFLEPFGNHLFGPIDRITILVDSPTHTVPITVPTGNFNPDDGMPDVIKCWLERIQGPNMSGTGITEEERELLINFALGYCVFFAEHDDVPESAYYKFISHFVAETLALRQPEPAAYALESAVEWLLGNLPGDVFDTPDIEILPITPYMLIPRDTQVTTVLANLNAGTQPANVASRTPGLIELCTFLVPAWMSYGERGPDALGPDGQTTVTLVVPLSSVYTEREYFVLPTKPDTANSGYDSNDSMPSLRYVADSSDDEDNYD